MCSKIPNFLKCHFVTAFFNGSNIVCQQTIIHLKLSIKRYYLGRRRKCVGVFVNGCGSILGQKSPKTGQYHAFVSIEQVGYISGKLHKNKVSYFSWPSNFCFWNLSTTENVVFLNFPPH